MAIEKQISLKTYTVSGSALKTYIGAGAGESIYSVELGERIKIITSSGANPIVQSHYFVTLNDAKTALGVGSLEEFYSINFASDTLTIITMKQTI